MRGQRSPSAALAQGLFGGHLISHDSCSAAPAGPCTPVYGGGGGGGVGGLRVSKNEPQTT